MCEFPSASLARQGAGLDAQQPPPPRYQYNRFYNDLQIKSAPLPVVILILLNPLGGYQTAYISDSVEQTLPSALEPLQVKVLQWRRAGGTYVPVRIEFISRTRSDVKVGDAFKISSERIQCVNACMAVLPLSCSPVLPLVTAHRVQTHQSHLPPVVGHKKYLQTVKHGGEDL